MKRINVYSVRLVKEKGGLYDLESKKVRSPQDAVHIINTVLDMPSLPKEHFVIATLNTKNEVMGIHTIHVGTVNASLVNPRDVYQQALLNNATSVIAFHNHPSGDPSPSREDIEVTERLVSAGKLIGVDLMDHIIIGSPKFVSLKEKGYV